MTDKTSDQILNELFHSLNLPPLPEDLPNLSKHKKRKRDNSSCSGSSENSDSDWSSRLNGNGKNEKKRHHKSKKKKKHKRKNKKQKDNKDESSNTKEIDIPIQDNNAIDTSNLDTKKACTIPDNIEQSVLDEKDVSLNQGSKIDDPNEMNSGEDPINPDNNNKIYEAKLSVELDGMTEVGTSYENDQLYAIQLPQILRQTDCKILEEFKPTDKEFLIKSKSISIESENDTEKLSNNIPCDEVDMPLGTIPLPKLSVSPKLMSESSPKDNSQSHGKGKSIIIKNLRDSLVFTLADEIKKTVELKAKKDINTQPDDGTAGAVETDALQSQQKKHKESSADKREAEKRKHKWSSNDKSRQSKYRSRDRSRSRRRKHSHSSRRDRSRSRSRDKYSRSSKRYDSSWKRRSYHRSRSSSKTKYRSSSRSNKSPMRTDSKSVSHRSFQNARSRHLSGDNSDTQLDERSKTSKDVKESSPDCVDLLRDKATRRKLLEVAKKNAVYMMKNDHLNLGVTKEIGKISGKSVEELTNFCKQLASRSDNDASDEYVENDSDPEFQAQLFSSGRHPFLVKDRPIVMNIRNAPMIKPKTNAERLFDQSKLRELFPVSSGSLHRNKVEIGWVTVEKDEKKDEKVFPDLPDTQDISISDLVSTRISAMRKLQDNPKDTGAISALTTSQKTMQDWALSKQAPGQFTGTTGARVMSQNELASGHQAWARKEQFKEANPVTSHFGLKMMQMMGWHPGEGLGKYKEGTVEPLLLDVKMDKKGLHAQEELTSRKVPIPLAKNLAGKHPVSALVELCSKRKWALPEFHVVFDGGPDHKKNFLMKVMVNNKEYKSSTATSTKKIAKANAAAACLQALGVLPKENTVKMQPSATLSPFLIAPNGMTMEEMKMVPTAQIPTPEGQPPAPKWS